MATGVAITQWSDGGCLCFGQLHDLRYRCHFNSLALSGSWHRAKPPGSPWGVRGPSGGFVRAGAARRSRAPLRRARDDDRIDPGPPVRAPVNRLGRTGRWLRAASTSCRAQMRQPHVTLPPRTSSTSGPMATSRQRGCSPVAGACRSSYSPGVLISASGRYTAVQTATSKSQHRRCLTGHRHPPTPRSAARNMQRYPDRARRPDAEHRQPAPEPGLQWPAESTRRLNSSTRRTRTSGTRYPSAHPG